MRRALGADAERTAISCRRPVARAANRIETFSAANQSNKTTARAAETIAAIWFTN